MIQALVYTLAFAVIQIFSSVIFVAVNKFAGGGETLSITMQIGTMVAASAVTIILFTALHWATPTRSYIQSRPWDVLAWSVVAAIGAVMPSMWVQEQMPELPNIVEEQLSEMMMHRSGYFVVCLLAPLAEELVFRGAVLRSLLAWRPQWRWGMIAVSALLFALVHFNPAQMPHAFVIGLLLGWMYERTRSIAPGIAYHWANNTVAYVLFRLYPDPSLRLVDVLGGQQRAVIAVFFSLLILLPALYQLHLRMRPVLSQLKSR